MIDILMAVYNGERFLEEQLESILAQSWDDWRLLIRDDASTDGTPQILQRYRDRYPERVVLYCNSENTGAPQKTFFQLVQDSTAPYLMTCDHDDVWLPDKISRTFEKMQELENRWGKELPLLVHTDLQVVDEELHLISPSMIKSQNLNPNANTLRDFIVQNHVTGCTMLFNRALAEAAPTLPVEALMHDWWFALIAAAFGKIGFVEEPTILYRQHGGNRVGAKSVSQMSFLASRAANRRELKEAMEKTYRQAAAFLREYESKLSLQQRELLRQYSTLPSRSKVGRMWTLCRGNYFKYGFVRKLGQLLYI